jgi:hypothetical protein
MSQLMRMVAKSSVVQHRFSAVFNKSYELEMCQMFRRQSASRVKVQFPVIIFNLHCICSYEVLVYEIARCLQAVSMKWVNL